MFSDLQQRFIFQALALLHQFPLFRADRSTPSGRAHCAGTTVMWGKESWFVAVAVFMLEVLPRWPISSNWQLNRCLAKFLEMEQSALTHPCHPALKTAHILLAKPRPMTKPACQWGLKVYSSHKKESLVNHMTVGRDCIIFLQGGQGILVAII